MAIKAEDFQQSFVDIAKVRKAEAYVDEIMTSAKRRELYYRGATMAKGIRKEEWGIDINISMSEQELFTLRGLYNATGWDANIEKKNTGRNTLAVISLVRSMKIN